MRHATRRRTTRHGTNPRSPTTVPTIRRRHATEIRTRTTDPNTERTTTGPAALDPAVTERIGSRRYDHADPDPALAAALCACAAIVRRRNRQCLSGTTASA